MSMASEHILLTVASWKDGWGVLSIKVGAHLKWTWDGARCQAPEKRAGPCRLGLMILAIRHTSPFEIMVKGKGLLVTDNAIEREAKRAGLAAVHRWSTDAIERAVVGGVFTCGTFGVDEEDIGQPGRGAPTGAEGGVGAEGGGSGRGGPATGLSYFSYHPVRTGPTADWYADRPLPGGTAKIDRRRSIKGETNRRQLINEGKGKRKRKNKKKKKYLARVPSLPAGDFSPHAGREIEVSDR
ncbi:hypothetical protein B296_00009597 [Ensete ventricosum]|uniref:Uncharacterized protein n=1 Tax=Ensete ventricosum TaxID=4639 RepID=A0A426Z956_ENSVE|nr:hypothetical protein B296_00009597 [Ensete ventricosum]